MFDDRNSFRGISADIGLATGDLRAVVALFSMSYHRLREIMTTLERQYHDLCDVEFTIERGRLWMLQTRVGKRTAAAAFVIAHQLVDEGLVDADEALRRVTGGQLAQLIPAVRLRCRRQDSDGGDERFPGAATGVVVFDSPTAMARAAAGDRVILVRRETTPDDLDGMIAAEGVLTSWGGCTNHAAVVARGMGTTCLCGAEELDIDVAGRRLTGPGGVVVVEGSCSPSTAAPARSSSARSPSCGPPSSTTSRVPWTPARLTRASWSARCTGS